MARCTCDTESATCTCVFDADGIFGQFALTGSGNADDPIVVGFNNSAWTNLPGTYVNGWSAYAGATYDVPQYRFLWGTYLVQLRGRLLHAAAFVKGQTILTNLPTFIRPDKKKWLLATSGKPAAGDNGGISITPGGDLICEVGPGVGAAFLQVDNVWYEAAP